MNRNDEKKKNGTTPDETITGENASYENVSNETGPDELDSNETDPNETDYAETRPQKGRFTQTAPDEYAKRDGTHGQKTGRRNADLGDMTGRKGRGGHTRIQSWG